jgi:hypothetical protein
VSAFADVRGDVATVHSQMADFCGGSVGADELACQLLGLCLSGRGFSPSIQRGAYETEHGVPLDHCWLEVDGHILDPTRDAFGADPLAEDAGLYCDVIEAFSPDADEAAGLISSCRRQGMGSAALAEDLSRQYGLRPVVSR